MLLENENAIVYGAAGGIGGGVARTFAREGAKVVLVGRTRTLDAVASDIRAAGGAADIAVLMLRRSSPPTERRASPQQC
jgi:NAD(P)-dependent dehydrogenase (short-subunit alcohol dehydrogenase family)